jgi:hypothetical protein
VDLLMPNLDLTTQEMDSLSRGVKKVVKKRDVDIAHAIQELRKELWMANPEEVTQ